MDRAPSRSALKRERVRDHLMELVESREPGDPIPSERALCEQLGVSRPTLRSAVDELVTTGLLVREHGRGMFVARAKITQELVPDASAHRLPQASGSWAGRVLEFTTVQAGARVGRKLHISPAAGIVYIARLRLVDGEPMAIEHLHVPAALVPGLGPADMESGDFYDVLRDRYGVRVHEAVQSIEPTVTNEEEARLIGVPVLSPALLFERLTKDAAGRPVEYVHSVYRGDRYRIVSRLSLSGGAPGPAAPFTGARHHPGIPPGDLSGRDGVPALTVGDVQPAD
ncbi:GntR family transcriptional regulator [Actinacidiphila sp. ITFR-21]|uniref:GntR family transcriptional regulator n=1 Tax=Actinacidiphila sp. ITFR-21 TaxID=3075199 RepID=UPI00288903CD|nr:GntR family transcriptional regulator [Streptomyces sp. ITFR-21]WNI18547.1 GntR family transcriptional regulator [Streptomyces sp. ITFR-21]